MSRIENEIEHGKFLASKGAESVWNWDSPAGRRRANRRAELLVNFGEISKDNKILEIGCGTGLFTGKIMELSGSKDVIAIDISPELLELAQKNHPDAVFKLGDAMNLDFNDNSFDVVFGSSVLHHLDMEKTCKEILRVLKPGGRLVFAEPNMINPQIAIQKNIPFIKKMLGDSPDETAINRWSFNKMLKRIGYKNINIIPYDFLHPITPNFLIPVVEGLGKVVEKIPVFREIAGSVIIVATK
jgi:ubiquinone/menaquinone biosynthesis C-methylase UbiE